MRDLQIARCLLACLAIALALASCDDGPPATPTRVSERDALVALYNATDGETWVNNTNWLTDAPVGLWYGVTTDGSGKVTRLDFTRNWSGGRIPAELGSLTRLEWVKLVGNGLEGEIPATLGGNSNLRLLELADNQLGGEIPSELGRLSSLELLSLSSEPAERGDTPRTQRASQPETTVPTTQRIERGDTGRTG